MEINKAKEVRNQVGGYVEHQPPPRLRRFIEALWTYAADATMAATAGGPHLVVPDPGVSLVFSCRRRANGLVEEPRLLFYGPVLRTRQFNPPPGRRYASLRLAPEWTTAVLGTRPHDHWNAIEDLASIAPQMAGPLMDRLVRTTNDENALGVLASTIGDLIARKEIDRDRYNPARLALECIRNCSGATSVDRLARRLEVSERHLRRRIQDLIGMPPKTFTRITRFIATMCEADRGPGPRWADLAVRFGYFDQAHMIRDFTALSGRTPLSLHRQRRAESEIYNIRSAA